MAKKASKSPSKSSQRSKAKPAAASTKVKAAAWSQDGELVLIADRDGKRLLLTVRDGKIIDERPALSRANRVVVLAGGTRLMQDGNGKTRAIDAAGKTVNASIEGYSAVDLVVCDGVAYTCGHHSAVGRWDQAAGAWQPTKLRTATDKLLKGGDDNKVHSLTAGARGPIAGVRGGTSFRTLIMEWDGSGWVQRAVLEGRFNGLARDPAEDVVYAVGDSVVAVDRRGKVRTVVEPDGDLSLWCAAWLGSQTASAGSLLVSDLWGVMEVAADGTLTDRAAPGKGEVPNNHSLFASGSRAAFVCSGRVHVTDGGARWSAVELS